MAQGTTYPGQPTLRRALVILSIVLSVLAIIGAAYESKLMTVGPICLTVIALGLSLYRV
jgi:hypothetical protein